MNSIPPPILLCETCGYALTGLDPDAQCPECGRDLQTSLPAHRQGSPAQRHASWRAWLDTVVAVVTSPLDIFRMAAIETRRTRGLLFTSTFVASLLASTSMAAVASTVALRDSEFDRLGAGVTIALFVVAGWAITVIASWIESVGIRFFGAQRGWRITREVAVVVVAHASPGWVVGGIIVAIGALLALIAGPLVGDDQPVIIIAFGGLFMGSVVGLFWFETLVYVGVRACRFANPPGVELPQPFPDPSPTQEPQPVAGAPVSHPGVANSPRAYDADASQ